MGSVAKPLDEAAEVRDLNVGAQRMCVIQLRGDYVDADGRDKVLRLTWNTGKPSPNSISTPVRKTLRPGESFRTTLERAQAWFGLFTMPVVLNSIYDEKKRSDLFEQYEHEKNRAIMTWGEYPRGNATGPDNNGGAIIGPARIPPVVLIVEEADGTRWDPIDLREQYELGDYYDVRLKNAAYFQPPARESAEPAVDEENAQLKERLAHVEGMLEALLAYGKKINTHADEPVTDAGGKEPAKKS